MFPCDLACGERWHFPWKLNFSGFCGISCGNGKQILAETRWTEPEAIHYNILPPLWNSRFPLYYLAIRTFESGGIFAKSLFSLILWCFEFRWQVTPTAYALPSNSLPSSKHIPQHRKASIHHNGRCWQFCLLEIVLMIQWIVTGIHLTEKRTPTADNHRSDRHNQIRQSRQNAL